MTMRYVLLLLPNPLLAGCSSDDDTTRACEEGLKIAFGELDGYNRIDSQSDDVAGTEQSAFEYYLHLNDSDLDKSGSRGPSCEAF